MSTLPTLTLSDGRVLQIDRSVVVGRSPAAVPADPAEDAHPVSLGADALLSRRHLRLDLSGLLVSVTDLDSENGTGLTRDGYRQTLRPGVTVALVDGDVLHFGGQSATYAAAVVDPESGGSGNMPG